MIFSYIIIFIRPVNEYKPQTHLTIAGVLLEKTMDISTSTYVFATVNVFPIVLLRIANDKGLVIDIKYI